MTVRKFWTQLHWLLGITAGTLLMLIGLTGAILSFREELLDAFNPGVRQVPAQSAAPATPDALRAALAQSLPEERFTTMTLYAEPGRAARVVMAPQPGQTRGDTVYLNPYTGALLPPLVGAEFFEVTEALHRWLLLPREPGRVVAGILAISLLILSLSGLYLRWPRDWRSVAVWWHVDPALHGRAFWRRLHLVVGTGCLLLYVISTATGIYWSFDAVRDPVSAWLGEPRAPRMATAKATKSDKPAKAAEDAGENAALDPVWAAFTKTTGADGWREAILRAPASGATSLQIQWLSPDAAHERARNRMTIKTTTAVVSKDERYSDKASGPRALAPIYPLHMGTFWGLPGRIVMGLASLLLPGFALTGWWLYLNRRKLERQAEAKRLARAAAAQ